MRIIQHNLAKIRKEGGVEHHRSNGRPQKIAADDNIAIGQSIRRNNEITVNEIVEKLRLTRNLNVSRWTVWYQLHRLGYKSVLPGRIPMLTNE